MRRRRPQSPSAAEVDRYLAALSSTGIFAGTSRSSLRMLAGAAEQMHARAGTDVVREGRVPTHFFVVATGVLEVFSTGEGEHAPVRVTSLQEGDHFGEIGLLEGMPATATVRAMTDSVLYRIRAADFLAGVAASPSLAANLVDRIAGGLARTHPTYAPSAAASGSEPERLLRDLARVADVVGPSIRPPGEQELLKAVTATAMNLFEASACSLALLLPDGSLVFRAASGAGADDVVGRVVARGEGIAGAVASSGEPLVVDDVQDDDRFAAGFAGSTGYRPRSIVARPLQSARGVVGVIEVLDGSAFERDGGRALLLLDLFARLAATAIENGRAFSDFGTALLAAAADAAEGTPLAEALEGAASGDRGGDVYRMAGLAHRLLQLEAPQRRAVLDELTSRLGGAGSRGS